MTAQRSVVGTPQSRHHLRCPDGLVRENLQIRCSQASRPLRKCRHAACCVHQRSMCPNLPPSERLYSCVRGAFSMRASSISKSAAMAGCVLSEERRFWSPLRRNRFPCPE
jgi:hypothetical protein